MPYGDSESNSYRIGDLTAQVSNLELDINGFKNNTHFEISDLKSASKYVRSDIEKLVEGQAELKRIVREQTQEIKNLQKIITMQGKSLAELERFTTETRKSLRSVRDIAMAEIIANKSKISDLESSLKYKKDSGSY